MPRPHYAARHHYRARQAQRLALATSLHRVACLACAVLAPVLAVLAVAYALAPALALVVQRLATVLP